MEKDTQVADIEVAAHQERTNSSPTAAKSPRVAVRDNEIVLNAFHENDPEVVELARKAKDGDPKNGQSIAPFRSVHGRSSWLGCP